MIEVSKVWKRYRSDRGPQDWVLKDVSFNIPTGRNVGLIGSNGAGKSTLLRIIGDIDQPTRGKVRRGCSISWPMGVGDGLQGALTGRQNTRFVSRILGRIDDYDNIVDFVREFSEIGSYFDEPVKTYSSGMKARLQFGLSLAFEFDVYISDEVTSVGDRAFREKASAAFRELTGRSSLIMVSHGEQVLREFCDSGIYLHRGKATWFDEIEEALEAYHKEAAASAKAA